MRTFTAITIAALLCSCTNGGKLRTGTQRYAAVPEQNVEILFETPTRPNVTIGIATVMGAALASETQMYRKLRKAAADMGADAVVVKDQRADPNRRNMSGAAIRYKAQ